VGCCVCALEVPPPNMNKELPDVCPGDVALLLLLAPKMPLALEPLPKILVPVL